MTATNNHPELIEKLTEGIRNLTSSEEWQRHLDFQSKFHRYSFNNALLIAAHRREPSQVAGFNAWRKINRFVRKGGKAIWILAPMVYKNAEAGDGEPEKVIRRFKFVPVFDVAQTNGGCCHSEHRIRVETRNTPAQRVKTLAHEIAHALLHETFDSRALAEMDAESAAYVVCQALGIDSSDYSFGYVATWAGGGEQAISGIKASCERIQRSAAQRSAATILRAFEPPHRTRRREPSPPSARMPREPPCRNGY